MHLRRSRHRSRAGFTLIEILITIALLGTLVAFVVVNFSGVLTGGQTDAARAFVNGALDVPLTKFRLDVGSYPTTAEGLAALSTAPSGKAARWKGPYINKPAVDPWGNPYQYRFPGTRNTQAYDLYSFGPDGVESADDIGNWTTGEGG